LADSGIFDDFLECGPQSSFWMACPGSHVLLAKSSPALFDQLLHSQRESKNILMEDNSGIKS
jgi:hypothetical protein